MRGCVLVAYPWWGEGNLPVSCLASDFESGQHEGVYVKSSDSMLLPGRAVYVCMTVRMHVRTVE